MSSSLTFSALSPEYARWLSTMQFTRAAAIDATARRLIPQAHHYAAASQQFGPPVAWLLAVGEREDGPAIFSHYFGNGDPLNAPTKDVPRNRGPFPTFEAGLADALEYERLGQVPRPWDWLRCMYEGEAWNGFGPRRHGKVTGYLMAGTSIYTGGKYDRDNEWNPDDFDQQLGIVPVMVRIIALAPQFAIPGFPKRDTVAMTAPPLPPAAPPHGVHDAAALQTALNALGNDPPLVVDDSYGRRTRMAVAEFQQANGLAVDGIAGQATWAAINARLSAIHHQAPPAPPPATDSGPLMPINEI